MSHQHTATSRERWRLYSPASVEENDRINHGFICQARETVREELAPAPRRTVTGEQPYLPEEYRVQRSLRSAGQRGSALGLTRSMLSTPDSQKALPSVTASSPVCRVLGLRSRDPVDGTTCVRIGKFSSPSFAAQAPARSQLRELACGVCAKSTSADSIVSYTWRWGLE